MLLTDMPLEILQLIVDFLDSLSQIRLVNRVCTVFKEGLRVTNLMCFWNLNLEDQVYKYPYVKYLALKNCSVKPSLPLEYLEILDVVSVWRVEPAEYIKMCPKLKVINITGHCKDSLYDFTCSSNLECVIFKNDNQIQYVETASSVNYVKSDAKGRIPETIIRQYTPNINLDSQCRYCHQNMSIYNIHQCSSLLNYSNAHRFFGPPSPISIYHKETLNILKMAVSSAPVSVQSNKQELDNNYKTIPQKQKSYNNPKTRLPKQKPNKQTKHKKNHK